MGVVMEGSHWADAVHVLDCPTMTWRIVNVNPYPVAPNTFYALYDSVQFICGGLFVVVNCSQTAGANPPVEFWAMPISQILAGTGMHWTKLNVTASSWPYVTCTDYNPALSLVSRVPWVQYSDGNFYAHARAYAPHTLWKLAPPAGNDVTRLTDVWTITTQTMIGDPIAAANFDYSRTQYCAALDAFLWTGEGPTGVIQVIKPT